MAQVMKLVAVDCPELETIAAYLDGRLNEREQARITAHLTACDDCYVVFSESAQIHVEAERAGVRIAQGWREWMTGPRLTWFTAGAALATAACLWLLVGSGRMMPSRQPERELQALIAAVGTDRWIEARLSGGFAYGPMRGSVRSGAPSAQTLSPDLRIAAASSEKALAGVGTPEVLHALGVVGLIVGDLDRAVPMIEQAVGQSRPAARMLSDLSAAYLARAARDQRPQDLTRALAAVDRAVKADPELTEALFNRALALDRLALVQEARTAWEDYLRIDDQSGWADEARAHLSALR
jgi:tetratricopeptide (TPR) repeat protein